MDLINISRIELAKKVLGCLDLTELNDDSDQKSIEILCNKALGYVENKQKLESTAAICIYSPWIEEARKHLTPDFKIASVVNFPTGNQNLKNVIIEIEKIINSGGDEIDCVFPYTHFFENEIAYCQDFLQTVRNACKNKVLKIILETSAKGYTYNNQANLLAKACELSITNGADFLKTSTGKISGGASIESIKIFINQVNKFIANNPKVEYISIKPSGGLKTLDDVLPYLKILIDSWGEGAITPNRFRIGASGLWSDLYRIILNIKKQQDNKFQY